MQDVISVSLPDGARSPYLSAQACKRRARRSRAMLKILGTMLKIFGRNAQGLGRCPIVGKQAMPASVWGPLIVVCYRQWPQQAV
jgi:hypothetical protein